MSITWQGIGISELWLNLTTLVYGYQNMKSAEIAGIYYPQCSAGSKQEMGRKTDKKWLHTYFQMSITWQGIGISELWLNLTTLVYGYQNMKSAEIARIYYPQCSAGSKQEMGRKIDKKRLQTYFQMAKTRQGMGILELWAHRWNRVYEH